MDREQYRWLKGYVPTADKTVLLGYHYDNLTQALEEFRHSTQHTVSHHDSLLYRQQGPLRECSTLYIKQQKTPATWLPPLTGMDNIAKLFLDLKAKIDPHNQRLIGRVYCTSLAHGKQIYAHSDTNDTTGDYWDHIERFQYYFTGTDNMIQLIAGQIYPVAPGMIYNFDFRQIHSYENHDTADLVLLVFDLYKCDFLI